MIMRNRTHTITSELYYEMFSIFYIISLLVPGTAPSNLFVVNKTATTITVNWTALNSSDADGYV